MIKACLVIIILLLMLLLRQISLHNLTNCSGHITNSGDFSFVCGVGDL